MDDTWQMYSLISFPTDSTNLFEASVLRAKNLFV